MDLSVVLVAYRMERELPRTIGSLCAPYQLGIGGLKTEIIVVSNEAGRDCPAELAAVPNLRWMQAEPVSASPVPALNAGLRAARGRLVGAWIDGARLASPGLLHGAWTAWLSNPAGLVATFNYHLGPTRQALASDTGYCETVEDALLEGINWPADGYRLFSIATPEAPTLTSPLLETNAPFMSKDRWADLGGFDEVFDHAGGGWANPDLLCRAVEREDIDLIRLVGEGTFHQFHGGITTSDAAQAARFVMEQSKLYAQLRGRPPRPVRKVGHLFQSPLSPIRDMV